ncbi:MAG: hypothetical protein Ct9H300mP22_0350 [Gammaproteobacteria bacterium]|nr:MAG: hypothetical protein Ct9H300mP22_0350 [Gammaproteobacteria bacterium]
MGIFLFFVIIVGTVALTFVAQKRTSSAADFFVADGKIGGVSNGFCHCR